MQLALLAAVGLLTAASARADADATAAKAPPSIAAKKSGAAPVAESMRGPSKEKPWGFTFKQKGMFGNQLHLQAERMFGNQDLPDEATRPCGPRDALRPLALLAAYSSPDLNADLNVFSNSTSSTTPTVTFGAGWTSGMVAYTGSYAITTLANDYQAGALDLGVSIRSDSDDFRTLLSVDVNETHHRNYIYIPRVNKSAARNQQDLSQRTATGSVSQEFFGNFDEKAALSSEHVQPGYPGLYERLEPDEDGGPTHVRPGGRESDGAHRRLRGFLTVKFGLSYDFDAIPLTLRQTYETIHLEDTAQGTNTTADVFA